MKILGFGKPEPKRRRRTKRSHKWLDYVKKEAESSPSLTQMVDDPLLKAAVLCRDNHFTLKITDFSADTMEGLAFIQYMISVIEAVRKENPPLLDDLKSQAIREGTKIVEKHSRRRRSHDVDQEIREEPEDLDENEPPVDIRPLRKPMVRRWPPPETAAPAVAPQDNPPGVDPPQLIEMIKKTIESAVQGQGSSSANSSEIISVDIDGKGTLVEMTRAGFELWKRDRDELQRLKEQGPQANGQTDQK